MKGAAAFFHSPAPTARHVVLLDPDKLDEKSAAEAARRASSAGVDALFVGGSTGGREAFSRITPAVKANASIPVYLFPGGADQIVPDVDAVLFMSLLSGRNPRFLVDEQVRGALRVREYGLEAIGMGYLLIESDKPSSVQKVSNTTPIARDNIESAVAHALCAQYFGMDMVYLEAGSGAGLTVPDTLIRAVKDNIRIPLIVGGGIRTPEAAAEKVRAGADIIVTGNVFEESGNNELLKSFAQAVHSA